MSGVNSLDFELVEGQPLATEITNTWVHWNGTKAEWRSRVEENKKYLLATSTKETTNVQNDHMHSTHIPKIAQIHDNLLANYMSALFPHDDWLRFEGQDPEAETFDRKQAVLAYIQTKNKLNNFRITIQELLNDWIIYGNAFAGVSYEQELHQDPDTGQNLPGYVGPTVYRISPDDIVFNPLATSFKKSPKIIRSLKSLGELHRDLEENPELGYSADIIDTITKNREVLKKFTDTAVDKHIQMQYDGFGSPSMYYKSGYVEILEFYGDIYDEEAGKFLKNRVITIVDRQYVIRNEPLNTWSGYPNIFHVAWRVRPDNLWGMGPLDNLVGMQYLINHLENSRADGFDQMLDPDRVFKGDVEIERRGAALDYYVTDVSIGGDVGHLAPDTTILNADFQIERKEQQMEEYAGAPREAMGIRTPGEKTKFEVQTLTNSASRMFQHKINYFEEHFVEPILNAEIEVARQNIDGTDLVRILDTDLGVAEFMQITKADLMSNGKIVPIGARHFARQASMAQELLQLQGVLQQDPMMAQHFPASNLAKVWEDILGFKRLELYEQFGRVNEELEYNRLKSAADEQVEVEQQIPIDESLGPQL